jgi:CDGSH-type Zn-finger protein
MPDVVVAQKSPYAIEAEAGRKYWWCACGRSSKQPFCDGSHKGSTLSPVPFVAAKTETLWLCGCKHTAQPPFCDGTHKNL